jgi:hypothetical protein
MYNKGEGGNAMTIELTVDQSLALAAEKNGAIVVIDPQTKQQYRLVGEEAYQKLQGLLCDDSPWTAEEMSRLAGIAFSKLDDEDYSHYLQEPK